MLAVEEAAPTAEEAAGEMLHGPFTHQINKGGLDAIVRDQQLISTTGRYGDEAVPAVTHEFFQPLADGGNGWVYRYKPEGERLDVIITRIAHPDGSSPSSRSEEQGMEYDFPDRGVRLRVADSWTARAAGTRAVVAHPRELSEVDPEHLPISVYIEVHGIAEALEPAAFAIMRRRAYAGGLDAKQLELAGLKAVQFEWTDGILDIESDFVAVQQNRALEITFAAEPERVDGKIRQHRALRNTLGRFVDVDFLVQQAAGR